MTSTLHIKNNPEQLALLYDFLEIQAKSCGIDTALLMQIKLAMDEAVTNVIQYAYPGMEGDIGIDMGCDDGLLKIVITDNGIPFNPLETREPDITLITVLPSTRWKGKNRTSLSRWKNARSAD